MGKRKHTVTDESVAKRLAGLENCLLAIASNPRADPEIRAMATGMVKGAEDYNPMTIPGVVLDQQLDRLKRAVDVVNTEWAYTPKPYGLWIDWQARPRRVVITQGIHIERDVIYP